MRQVTISAKIPGFTLLVLTACLGVVADVRAEVCRITFSHADKPGNRITYENDAPFVSRRGDQTIEYAVGGEDIGQRKYVTATEGPCHFEIFDHAHYQGKRVILGTDLNHKIRGGINGVRHWDSDRSGTWKIGSLRFLPMRETGCRLTMSDFYSGHIKMTYFASADRIPNFSHVLALEDGALTDDCRARVYDEAEFNANETDKDNVYADLVPARPEHGYALVHDGQNESDGFAQDVYEAVVDSSVLWHAASVKIWNDGGECTTHARDRGRGVIGRCLPQIDLGRSLYGDDVQHDDEDGGDVPPVDAIPVLMADGMVPMARPNLPEIEFPDADHDGMGDFLENVLAEAFKPIYINHSTENATRVDAYLTHDGEWVTEPVTLFQVHPVLDENGRPDSGLIRIQFMKLWDEDVYGDDYCGGHLGDSQRNNLYLRTVALPDPRFGKLWWVVETSGGIRGDLAWRQGQNELRAPIFERLRPDEPMGRHMLIYFSKGKHHEYSDTGFSGRTDKHCSNINAYVNAHGQKRCYLAADGEEICLAKRAAELRSPSGEGDAYGLNNVGNSAYPFINDLESFGFEQKLISVEARPAEYETIAWGPPCVWGFADEEFPLGDPDLGCSAFFYDPSNSGAGRGFE